PRTNRSRGGGWRIDLDAAGGTNPRPVPERTQRPRRGTNPMGHWAIWAEAPGSSWGSRGGDRIHPTSVPERTQRPRRTQAMGPWVVCAERSGVAVLPASGPHGTAPDPRTNPALAAPNEANGDLGGLGRDGERRQPLGRFPRTNPIPVSSTSVRE